MSTFSTADHAPPRDDSAWMRHAISLALQARGQTHPNPLVGAVIVAKDGTLLAEGWHAQDGGPHAEIAALNNLRELCINNNQADGQQPRTTGCHGQYNHPGGQNRNTANADHQPTQPQTVSAQGATLYVTLEPCSTCGRTGACTDAIIRAGIARVVIGAIDPYPGHGGNAIPVLEKAGIAVTCGILANECADLNLIFNHRVATGLPFIAVKVAVTLDGKIATRAHNSRWISGEASRQDVMLWRRTFPAIGVGAGTVLADNPSLTARLPLQTETPANAASSFALQRNNGSENAATDTGRQPTPAGHAKPEAATVRSGAQETVMAVSAMPETIWCPRRLIFDRSGRTAERADATVFTDAFAHRTLVITTEGAAAKRLEPLRQAGIAIATLPAQAFQSVHFATALRDLLKREHLAGLYVEGGGGLLSDLLAARALDYLFSYRAPKLLADAKAISPFDGCSISRMADAFTLRDVRHAFFGDDQLMRGHIVYPQDVQSSPLRNP